MSMELDALADAREDVRRLTKERDELRAALEPFTDLDGEGSEDHPDETPAVVQFGRVTNYELTLGDFRRARNAYGRPA